MTESVFSLLCFVGGPKPDRLQEVSVPVIGHEKCMEIFRLAGLEEKLTDVFICAGFREGGKDACEVRNTTHYFTTRYLALPCQNQLDLVSNSQPNRNRICFDTPPTSQVGVRWWPYTDPKTMTKQWRDILYGKALSMRWHTRKCKQKQRIKEQTRGSKFLFKETKTI